MVKTGYSLAHKGCIYGVSTMGVGVSSRKLKKRKSGGRAQIKAKETEALTPEKKAQLSLHQSYLVVFLTYRLPMI